MLYFKQIVHITTNILKDKTRFGHLEDTWAPQNANKIKLNAKRFGFFKFLKRENKLRIPTAKKTQKAAVKENKARAVFFDFFPHSRKKMHPQWRYTHKVF